MLTDPREGGAVSREEQPLQGAPGSKVSRQSSHGGVTWLEIHGCEKRVTTREEEKEEPLKYISMYRQHERNPWSRCCVVGSP